MYRSSKKKTECREQRETKQKMLQQTNILKFFGSKKNGSQIIKQTVKEREEYPQIKKM